MLRAPIDDEAGADDPAKIPAARALVEKLRGGGGAIDETA
jgi:hypothetical protein